MTNILQTVVIPYEDCMKMRKDSADLEAVKSIITAEFPDDTCQIIAIKAILGIVEEEDDTQGTDPSDPSDPSGTTDPIDPTP